MTARACFVVCLACALACGGSGGSNPGGGGSCVNVNNTTWDATVTTSSSNSHCNGLTDSYEAAVTQTGCTGSLTVRGNVLAGTISGSTVSWSGSYPFNSGTLSITSANLTIASDLKSASGNFNFSYSGQISCTGTGTFTATIASQGGGSGPGTVSGTVSGTSQPVLVSLLTTEYDTVTATTTTDATGNYSFPNVTAASYYLVPGGKGLTFTPASITVNVSGDLSGQDFTAAASTAAGPFPALNETDSMIATGKNAFNYTQGSYLSGFEFKVAIPVNVTALGYWDSNFTGSTESFGATSVGLFDMTTNSVVGSVSVQGTDPATGSYRYHALASPIALNTTDTYAVDSVTGGNNYVSGLPSSAFLCYGGYACSDGWASFPVQTLKGACLGGNGDCLTQTTTLVEPTDTSLWINLGSNFLFTIP